MDNSWICTCTLDNAGLYVDLSRGILSRSLASKWQGVCSLARVLRATRSLVPFRRCYRTRRRIRYTTEKDREKGHSPCLSLISPCEVGAIKSALPTRRAMINSSAKQLGAVLEINNFNPTRLVNARDGNDHDLGYFMLVRRFLPETRRPFGELTNRQRRLRRMRNLIYTWAAMQKNIFKPIYRE